MSLELEIKNLNDTILKLIATMEKQPVQLDLPFETDCPIETKKEKVVDKKENKTITPEELQSECMALVRKDPSNKVKIKNLLADFEVTLIAELNKEALPNFARRLGEL